MECRNGMEMLNALTDISSTRTKEKRERDRERGLDKRTESIWQSFGFDEKKQRGRNSRVDQAAIRMGNCECDCDVGFEW